MKTSASVVLPRPESIVVPSQPHSNLMQELHWYLEDFLELPIGAYLDRARRTQDFLKQWGLNCFQALFKDRARDWFQKAREAGLENLRLKISSDDPVVLSWPWEALCSPDDDFLAHHCCIERQPTQLGDPLPLHKDLPGDRINILLVIARPFGEDDVGYQSLSRRLIDLARDSHQALNIDVLRPPTFDRLREQLRMKPGFYHIVHFDGHGGYGATPTLGGSGHHTLAGSHGRLYFEDNESNPEEIDAVRLSTLLHEYRIPVVVLNACQSAMVDGDANNAFASVAAGLLRAGIRSVVAMGYSVSVSGAQEFVPAFYQRLRESGNVGEATRAGRQAMLRQPERACILGHHRLDDWLVPVFYQQLAADVQVIPMLTPSKPDPKTISMDDADVESAMPLPTEVQQLAVEDFIGRERAIQELERASLRQRQGVILIHGMAGVGKTTLAKGFLHWLKDTNGLAHSPFWFDFQGIRSAEHVINALAARFDENARLAPMEKRLAGLTKIFKEHPFWIVWDNFESVSGIAGTNVTPTMPREDRDLLQRFIRGLRGGKTKILMTSRSQEDWLKDDECYRLRLGGLRGEELWTYCNAIMRELGLAVDRESEDFGKLLEKLDGNPLSVRVMLLRLKDLSASELLVQLEEQYRHRKGNDDWQRVAAAIAVFDGGIPENFAPVLRLVGLHDRFVDRDYVKFMLEVADEVSSVDVLEPCFRILEMAGLCEEMVKHIYRMHPALRSYLSERHPATEPEQRVFVDLLGRYADALTSAKLHEQRWSFIFHGANFYHAGVGANMLRMIASSRALIQCMAVYAQNTRDYEEASRGFEALAQSAREDDDLTTEAFAYHQLGRVAQEQRGFTTAEAWYRKSLAISEELGNERYAAGTYHQLGIIAHVQRDFAAAEVWYRKSLIISEKLRDEHSAADTYHQLGIIAYEQQDFIAAEAWCQKSLVISEKLRNEHRVAGTCHQLGMIAEEKRDFAVAETLYRKALVIWEKLGYEHRVAGTYHQLGSVAQEQQDFAAAEVWYRKSLVISEKLRDEHRVAGTYHQLGMIAGLKQDFVVAEAWYRRALVIWEKLGDEYRAAMTIGQLGVVYGRVNRFEDSGHLLIRSIKLFTTVRALETTVQMAGNAFVESYRQADQAAQARLKHVWQMELETIIPFEQVEKIYEGKWG